LDLHCLTSGPSSALPAAHAPVRHVPDSHSASSSQVAPAPLSPCFFGVLDVHPGRPGGQSLGFAHCAGGAFPGRCGGSPESSDLMGTLCGALRVPLVASTSPFASMAWMKYFRSPVVLPTSRHAISAP